MGSKAEVHSEDMAINWETAFMFLWKPGLTYMMFFITNRMLEYYLQLFIPFLAVTLFILVCLIITSVQNLWQPYRHKPSVLTFRIWLLRFIPKQPYVGSHETYAANQHPADWNPDDFTTITNHSHWRRAGKEPPQPHIKK